MIKTKKLKNSSGFVILFAVTLSAILLAIALGVAEVAFKEVQFGTSAKDTNNAFFAADTGAEYVLYLDRNSDYSGANPVIINGLGVTGLSCAIVNIQKVTNDLTLITTTTIISKGYNVGGDTNCNSTNPNRVEREIKITY